MDEKASVGRRLYESFTRVFGWPAAAITTLAGLFAPLLLKVDAVPYSVALPVGGLLLLITAVAVDWASRERLAVRNLGQRVLELEGSAKLPSVLACKTVVRGQVEVTLLILKYSTLYARGHLVSIYSVEPDQFERPLGYGTVDHVQINGLMQIEIIDWRPDSSDTLQRIINNDRAALDAVLVQPSVPSSIATLNRSGQPETLSTDEAERETDHERSTSEK